MAIIRWTSYSFDGDGAPVSETKYAELRRLSPAALDASLAALRRDRWSQFRQAQMSDAKRLKLMTLLGIGLLVAGAAITSAFPLGAMLVQLPGVFVYLGCMTTWVTIGASASTCAEAIGAECHFLRHVHQLASKASSYSEYYSTHHAELTQKRLVSSDARLALVIACFGFLIIPIPLVGPLAIILGHLGRRKRARFATLAMALGYVEVLGLALALFISTRN